MLSGEFPFGKFARMTALYLLSPDGVKLQLNVYRPMQIGRYPAIVIL
jgi:predicted acyl esterase